MFVLTGASGGLGKQIIPGLLQKDTVIGIYNTRVPDLPASSDLRLEQLNISNAKEVQDFAQRYNSQLKKIVLLHFAVQSIDGLATNYADKDWDQIFSVNLKGNFILTKALLPAMIGENWGRIVHISSVVGLNGDPGTIAYSSSKTGLLGMSKVLSREYGRCGITSNILNLGYFDAGLINRLPEQKRKKILKQIPSKKLGSIENIVNAIDFIRLSDYVNGSVIDIHGGL